MNIRLVLTRRLAERSLVTTAAAACVLATVGACSKKTGKPPAQAVPVIVAPAVRADVPYEIQANGVVSPINTAAITAQVDGLITKVTFREGQDVAKGAVLFQIEPRPYKAAYDVALANLARDKETNTNAQAEVARYADLVKQDYVTKEQADQQKATAGSAAAVVQADEAAVETAKFNLDNTTVRAPIAGRTGGLLVREGNVVHAGTTTPLVVINQVSPILVRFPVSAADLPLIQKYGGSGQLAVTATPGGARQSANDTSGGPPGVPGSGDPSPTGDAAVGSGSSTSSGAGSDPAAVQLLAQLPPAQGTLFFIDNSVDTLTGTVTLKASFPNTEKMLWSGQFVSTTLHLFTEKNALVVPTEAVVTGQQGAYVYIVDSSGAAQQRKVSVERAEGEVSIITAGLRDGEQVVRTGQSRLTAGAKVRVTTPGAADSSGGMAGGRADTSAKGARAAGGTGRRKRPAAQ